MGAFVVEVLQVRLAPAAASTLSKQAEHLGVVDSWQEFGNEAQGELRVGRRHLLVKLLVEEAKVHHHVVADNWLADLRNFLYDDTEAKLVSQHAFDRRFDVLLTRFAVEDLVVFLWLDELDLAIISFQVIGAEAKSSWIRDRGGGVLATQIRFPKSGTLYHVILFTFGTRLAGLHSSLDAPVNRHRLVLVARYISVKTQTHWYLIFVLLKVF